MALEPEETEADLWHDIDSLRGQQRQAVSRARAQALVSVALRKENAEARLSRGSAIEAVAPPEAVQEWPAAGLEGVVTDRAIVHPLYVGPPLIIIVASAGGTGPLQKILASLPKDFAAPIVIVQHDSRVDSEAALRVLRFHCVLPVEAVQNATLPLPGIVYRVPGANHLTFDKDGRFCLHDVDEMGRIKFVCPSGDLLLESVARQFGSRAVAVVLSGTGDDGAIGCRAIITGHGRVMAQDQPSCIFSSMPAAAAALAPTALILQAGNIGLALIALAKPSAS